MQTHLLLLALLLAGTGHEAGFVHAQQGGGNQQRQEIAASNPASPRIGGDDSPILASGEWAPTAGSVQRGDLTGRFNRKWLTARSGDAEQNAEDEGDENSDNDAPRGYDGSGPAESDSDSGRTPVKESKRQGSTGTKEPLCPPIPQEDHNGETSDDPSGQNDNSSGMGNSAEDDGGGQNDANGVSNVRKDEAPAAGKPDDVGKKIKGSKQVENTASGDGVQNASSKQAGRKQHDHKASAKTISDFKHAESQHHGSAQTDSAHYSKPSTVPLHHRKHSLMRKPARKHRQQGDGRREFSTQQSGKGTYYNPGQNRGACGGMDTSKDLVAAISHRQWANGNYCGKSLNVCHQGKCVDVRVVDECMGCNPGDLDLSPSAFKRLAKLEQGVIPIDWTIS